MAVELKMPQLGESVHEGTIGKWLKQKGDRVEKYDPVLEVITDKVDTEVTAVESGTLLDILVPEDETVSVGTVLAIIGEPGEDTGDLGSGGASRADDGGDKTESSASDDAKGGGSRREAAPAKSSTPATDSDASNGSGARQTGSASGRVSPVAARMAAEHDVDLSQLQGSGRGGQITRRDVEQFLSQAGSTDRAEPARSTAPTPSSSNDAKRDLGFISPRVARLAAEHGADLRRVAGSGRDGRITARDVERFVESGAAEEAVPAATEAKPRRAAAEAEGPALGERVELTRMRKLIADHMVHSKQTSPHVTTVHEVDMSAVMSANRKLKPELEARGVKLTLTAFMLQCLAEAVAEHPLVNSSWADGAIQIHRDINLGMAVALPDGGLIVPVIKHADELNLAGMARAVGDLATRAREGNLKPDDIQGGTLTVTNYGTLGSLFGTPVINQPQCAILGTGAIRKRVVVVEGADGSDQIGIRPMMYLALTFDHRILDGGTADPFVQTLVRKLEGYSA